MIMDHLSRFPVDHQLCRIAPLQNSDRAFQILVAGPLCGELGRPGDDDIFTHFFIGS